MIVGVRPGPPPLKASDMTEIETLMNQCSGVIFDCDGTLLRTPDLYATAWQEAFGTAGLEMAAEWYHARAGMSEDVLLDAFESDHGGGFNRKEVVRAMRSSVLGNIESVREIPSVCDIARRNYRRRPLAVASSGPKDVVLAALRSADLLPLFETVVTIEDVVNAKPAPDLFLEAASRLKLAPKDCLVFEDSQQGLQAAQNAGMQVIDVNQFADAC